MAAIQGRGGKVLSGASTVAFVESWEANISDEALNTTGLGDTSQTYIGRGCPDNTWSIKWKALDQSDTGTATFRTAVLANASGIQLKLYDSATKYWDSGAGNAIVTGTTQSVGVDGLVTGTAQGVFDGSPTYT